MVNGSPRSALTASWTDAKLSRTYCAGACWGFIFHHLEYARFERDTLLLEWSIGTIRIRGPKAEIFFDKFANHQATSISADGKDIESVTMRLKTDEAVEEAFAAIEKLTDADLNIDDELDERGVARMQFDERGLRPPLHAAACSL